MKLQINLDKESRPGFVISFIYKNQDNSWDYSGVVKSVRSFRELSLGWLVG